MLSQQIETTSIHVAVTLITTSAVGCYSTCLIACLTCVCVFLVQGTTPLHMACSYGHLECVKVLMKAGACPTIWNVVSECVCVCVCVCVRGRSDLVKALLPSLYMLSQYPHTYATSLSHTHTLTHPHTPHTHTLTHPHTPHTHTARVHTRTLLSL